VVSAPEGTVTLLFTDIAGSTRLLLETGEGYADLLLTHRRLLREAFETYRGYEVDTEGDAFFVAFASAGQAVAAAGQAQRSLAAHEWPDGRRVWVRMGIHTGEPRLLEGNYIGLDVHHAARVMAAGHGGQVLISQTTRELLHDESDLDDLGEHRLKDLSRPQRLFQLQVKGLPDEFPPLKSLHQTNLPVQPTPLIGRERELSEVLSYLRGGTRLLTLTGTGGTGKTRLALHAAAELADDYPDGVWFVSLAPITDPALVESAIGQTLGLRGELQQELQGKRLLLVLDNLEQLLDAAPAIAAVLATAPEVAMLVTSRERLAVAAEQEYPVPTLAQAEGIDLFVERARRLRPGFTPDPHVNAIVTRLDGLPLAIELAAARTKVLTAAQIEQRLTKSLDLLTGGGRDAPERQRTLRATIQWSYDLLDQHERDLLAALAVFAGSFPLEAAETICNANLDTLQSLLDKSLLRATDDGRFFLLDTIRAYAGERLDERPDTDEIKQRHADYTLALLGNSDALGEERVDHSDRWAAEILAAVAWAHARKDHGREIRLLTTSEAYWLVRGLTTDARRWVEDAIRHAPENLDPELHAVIFGTLSALCHAHGDMPRASEAAHQAVAHARKGRNKDILAHNLNAAGMVAIGRGDTRQATPLLEEAVAIARSLASVHLASSLMNQGMALFYAGQFDEATIALRESQAIHEGRDSYRGLATTTFNLGLVALSGLDYQHARHYFHDTLRLAERLQFTDAAMYALEGLAAVAARTGEFIKAAELLGAAEQLRDQTGAALESYEQHIHDETLQMVEQHLEPAELAATLDRGRDAAREDITAPALEIR